VQQLTQRAAQLNEFHARRLNAGDATVAKAIRWHMIGHLQRNKIKALLPFVHMIHSVDSLRLAEELDTQGAKAGRKISVLMQVNASEETQKSGVAVGAAVHLAEQIASMPNVQIAGLMTFARTRELFEEMKWHKIGGNAFKHLSMGMSQDYELAIAEGSTMVRVGSAIFGGKWQDHEEEEEK
jgi:pyridoxal phosphate enzyme (YggS family)